MSKNNEPLSKADNTPTLAPIFLSVKETRQRLSLGHTTVYALIKSGRLRSCLFGRRRLIEAASVDELAHEILSKSS